jgi:cytochrome oxidase assembly protein ShyY1
MHVQKNSWTPTNQPEIGLWFSIDVESMAKVTGCKPVLVEIVYGS